MKRPITELTEDLNRMLGAAGKALAAPEFRSSVDRLIRAINSMRDAIEELEQISPQRAALVEDWDKWAAETADTEGDR